MTQLIPAQRHAAPTGPALRPPAARLRATIAVNGLRRL